MSEDDSRDTEQDTSPPAPEARPPERPVHRHRRRWPWVLAAVVLTPVLLFVAWVQITLHYTYSRGTRAGYVQKFSEKGWLCKTWEGELAQVTVPGAVQEKWAFSVRDDSIARLVEQSEGKQVQLTYEQHKGVPTSCFAETEFFVIGIRSIGQ